MAVVTTLVFLLSVLTPLAKSWWIFGNRPHQEHTVRAVGGKPVYNEVYVEEKSPMLNRLID